MREITTHVVNPEGENLKIEVIDEPGVGGAHHEYRISGYTSEDAAGDEYEGRTDLFFQNVAIAGNDPNGITMEALLAIVSDRLRCFQEGPFACDENAEAQDHCQRALVALKKRTKDRMARGVEGKTVK